MSEWRNWPMLVPCVIGVMLCSVHNYSLGVMVGPLERQFGWTRAEISSGPFIIAMIALLGGPMAGVFVDRIGPRRIALFGVPFFCASLALISTSNGSIWTWWGLWTIVGISAMMVIPSMWTTAISSLYFQNRGKALAIALTGTGIGAALMPMTAEFLVEGHGWRGAYIGLAILLFVIAFPLTLFLFRSALDNRQAAAVAQQTDAAPAILTGYTAREGFASLRFYKLAIAITLFSVAICGFTANMVPILIANGLTPAKAAGIAGLMGIGSIIGRLAGGVLIDRYDAKKVAAASVLSPCFTAALLIAFPGSIPAAMAASLVLGLAIGTELSSCAYLSARHFGLRSLGTLFGAINGLMLFANGLGPMLANLVFDLTRSYHLFLLAATPAFLLTAVLFLLMGRYPDFDTIAEPSGTVEDLPPGALAKA
jgi:MFS family permease